MSNLPEKDISQKAEKIINIEHVENVHIEAPDYYESLENLNQVIERIPEIIETSIVMLSQKADFNTPIDKGNRLFAPLPLKKPYKTAIDIGDIVMSHWQIDRCIGKGSFSTVYEAHHTGSLYKSAIKIFHSDSFIKYYNLSLPEDTTRFPLDTTFTMARIELDNLIKLKGTGYIVEYEDHDFFDNMDGSQNIIIRMELLKPLSEVLSSKKMSREEVINLGIDICKALEFCNKENIIHRDVKPSNIYLTKWGGYKLGDFSAATRTGVSRNLDQVGTLKYMAPEVYAGKMYSSNIDTYSLGIVLYELLKKTESIDFYKRLSGEPLSPISDIDQPLQSIIFKACSYNPDDRFSSPTEMLNELLKVK